MLFRVFFVGFSAVVLLLPGWWPIGRSRHVFCFRVFCGLCGFFNEELNNLFLVNISVQRRIET